MLGYNPFDKPFSEIESSDIYGLTAPEGIYVEYKRSFIENKSIAKSVSSFANTHGGVLVIGIEENSDSNIPSDWFTLNLDSVSQPKESIRNIVRDHIQPSPNFETYIVRENPESNNCVLIISVPESKETPHINNDGCVYRRTGEGSDPYREETNPAIFDELYERRSRYNQRIEDFCQSDLGYTSGQLGETDFSSQGWAFLELYAVPSTLGDPVCSEVLSDRDGFKELLTDSEITAFEPTSEFDAHFGRSYHSFRSTSRGMVAQNWGIDEDDRLDIPQTPETYTFFADGSLKYLLPIPTLSPSEIRADYWTTISETLDGNTDYINFLNGVNLMKVVFVTLNSYISHLNRYNWISDQSQRRLGFKIRVRNAYRTMTVFQSAWYQKMINEWGAPVCYENIIENPRSGVKYVREIGDAFFNVVVDLIQSLGIPAEESENAYIEWLDTTNLMTDSS